MVKKIPLIISTLIATVLTSFAVQSPQVQAYTLAEDQTYLTLDELQAISNELDEERRAVCEGQDLQCEYDYYFFEQSNRGWPEWGVSQFLSHQFLITRINPYAKTVTVLFKNSDRVVAQTETPRVETPTELYISWFRGGYDEYPLIARHKLFGFGEEERFYYTWVAMGQATSDYVVPLVSEGNVNTDGAKSFPAGTEVTFETMSDLPTLETAPYRSIRLFANVFLDDDNTFDQTVYYDECFYSSDYDLGDECRLVYDLNGRGFHYRPFDTAATAEVKARRAAEEEAARNAISAEDQFEDPFFMDDPLNDLNNSSTTVATTENGEGSLEEGFGNATSPLLAPNTGDLTAEDSLATVFPWWSLAVIFASSAFVAWYFGEKSKKVQKS